MALGNYDNNKKQQSVNVYSPYKMSNTEGIDPSAINFTFCLNLLKISISPKKPGDMIAFDHEKAIECFVTHLKAKMLYDDIKYMLSHKGEVHNVAIPTGKDGIVEFSDGTELGTDNYTLLLRKTDENQKVIATYAYEFKMNHHFTMRNYDSDHPANYDKVIHEKAEIDMFLTLLKTYYEAMSGAAAYMVVDNMKYSQSKTNTKLDTIMEKLGIEIPRGNFSNRQNNTTAFSNNHSGNTYKQGSIDDYSSMMNTPED